MTLTLHFMSRSVHSHVRAIANGFSSRISDLRNTRTHKEERAKQRESRPRQTALKVGKNGSCAVLMQEKFDDN